jgi:hypothetical protein
MAIFTILILPIHEHGRSFYLLKLFSISLFSGLQFSFDHQQEVCEDQVSNKENLLRPISDPQRSQLLPSEVVFNFSLQ